MNTCPLGMWTMKLTGTLVPAINAKLLHFVPAQGPSMWGLRWLAIGASVVAVTYAAGMDAARARRVRSAELADVNSMDDRSFILYLAHVLRRTGHQVRLERRMPLGQTELRVRAFGARYVVCCAPSTRANGADAVRGLIRSARGSDSEVPILVASSSLGPEAEDLALRGGVQIWGREALATWVVQTSSTATSLT